MSAVAVIAEARVTAQREISSVRESGDATFLPDSVRGSQPAQ